jgi:predicted benzoate:H+ symporter BenE
LPGVLLVVTRRPPRVTGKQWAAGKALAAQLALALVATALAAGYVLTEAAWIPPLAGVALLATVVCSFVTARRIREESRERQAVERMLAELAANSR